jgi:hypothetical protein
MAAMSASVASSLGRDGGQPEPFYAILAATNKCLAESNKLRETGQCEYSQTAREPLAAPQPNTKGFQCSAHL